MNVGDTAYTYHYDACSGGRLVFMVGKVEALMPACGSALVRFPKSDEDLRGGPVVEGARLFPTFAAAKAGARSSICEIIKEHDTCAKVFRNLRDRIPRIADPAS